MGFIALIFGMMFFINSNIQENSKFNFAQATLLVGFAIFIISVSLYFGALATDRYYRTNDPKVKEAYEDEILLKDIDEQSRYFLQIPITTLYYGDYEEIENIYTTYFGEDTVIAITSETSEETGGEINALFSKFFGMKHAGKDSTKIVKSYKPKEETILNKFLRYQRATILRRQVNLGLEFVRVDFSDLNEFQDNLNKFTNTYQINLEGSANELDRKYSELYDKGVEETFLLLERAKDLILMEEKFSILENDTHYICNYLHPVSEYVAHKGIQVIIKFSIPKANLHSPNFDFAQVVGKVIPIRVFGKVVLPLDRKSNNWEMLIKPIAVH